LPAEYSDEDLISRWEEFYEATPYRLKVMEAATLFPELRSIYIRYSDLDAFDPDMADYILQHPNKGIWAGEEAIKKTSPPGREGAKVHMRLVDLPRDCRVEIRDLRSKHMGKLISIEGLVRKATEVRPKITDALFKCFRCGAVIKEPQEGMQFKEPLECYENQGGCGKSASSTKFKLLTEESTFVDTQKIEMQENPEGLRGGAQPERLTGFLEDDIAGSISPGDRVILNGTLRSVQKGAVTKSTLFDIHLDVLSMEFKEHEYEDVMISKEDEVRIMEEASDPDVYKKIVASISPTIYGYDIEKESIALQLFGGVSKELDDGTRIRGDIHILLVGDPGVAKCVSGDSRVLLASGHHERIRDIVDEALRSGPTREVSDGVCSEMDLDVISMRPDGIPLKTKANIAWKRSAPSVLFRFKLLSGKVIVVTPTHPFFIWDGGLRPIRAKDLRPCDSILAFDGDSLQGGVEVGVDISALELPPILDWVMEINEEEPMDPYVYDLQVPEYHNFIAEGIIVHNSQLLRYMSTLAPRGIYASGKSSSAAGLCVSPLTHIMVDGKDIHIEEFVEENMDHPDEVEEGVEREEIDGPRVACVDDDGKMNYEPVKAIWRIDTPSVLVELETDAGHRLRCTPETNVWSRRSVEEGWRGAMELNESDELVWRGHGGDQEPAWEPIVKTMRLQDDLPMYVYDLTVSNAHAFLGGGFLVHNTAAAVKDDFGEGRWTLEAGALVLADKGVACVDELDKMTDQDRSSMHEAMESQTISVAKAGITATLQCRCSILGAANPKYGRFEERQYIADQINLPPTLMSRFDLIFAMTDKPDAKRDAHITDHILKAHWRGQIRKYADTDLEEMEGVPLDRIMEETKELAPAWSRDFLRKYVAFSKRITPVLTEEAMRIIHDCYMQIRKQGDDQGSVPITARQLEAFVRLSEASARARLSNRVMADDANRAVRLVEYYLNKIAGQEGQLDIDIIATGTSRSQREQISVLRRLISNLSERERGVSVEALVQAAEVEGIQEDRIRRLLKRLSDAGEVYSPHAGYYKLATEG